VDAAAKVRDLNFKYITEGKGATVTARFGPDGITICDPNRASEGADEVFQRICGRFGFPVTLGLCRLHRPIPQSVSSSSEPESSGSRTR
jgi:hypothetical protein